jgi:hypothetical protein
MLDSVLLETIGSSLLLLNKNKLLVIRNKYLQAFVFGKKSLMLFKGNKWLIGENITKNFCRKIWTLDYLPALFSFLLSKNCFIEAFYECQSVLNMTLIIQS